MLSFLVLLTTAVVNFLLSFLPASPIQAFVTDVTVSSFATALGWLNWFVPVSNMLALMSVWLAAIVTYRAVKFALDNTVDRVAGVGKLG